MALKRNANGQYVLKNAAEASRALEMMERLQAEVAELEKEHGIDEMKMDCVELKKAATAYLVNNGDESLTFGGNRIAKIVRAVHSKVWVGTKEDLAKGNYEPTVKPLRSLVDKETWMQITTRVPDPAKIDEAVAEGIVTANKIAPAYVETTKAPYLSISNHGDKA
jgi:hypothetical protein